MGAEVEVKLVGVGDANIHCGTSRDVAAATNLKGEIKEMERK